MQQKNGTWNRVSAKAVGSFLPNVTRKAFQKFGFPAAALLTDWEAIVGKQMATFTRPERLKWPKLSPDAVAEDGSEPANPGATLVLRVDGPLAIELQHQSDQFIERINGYFGYRAIASLRILQAPLTEITTPAKRAPLPRAVVTKRRQAELANARQSSTSSRTDRPRTSRRVCRQQLTVNPTGHAIVNARPASSGCIHTHAVTISHIPSLEAC